MARESLRAELGGAVRRAVAERVRVTVRGLMVGTEAAATYADLTVDPVSEPEALRGLLLVVFEEVAAPQKPGGPARRGARSPGRLELANAELEKERRYTKERLQTVIEEMATSREELQSLNEEIATVNAELQAKNDELTRAGNDMSNLLNGTQVPTLFLDGQLRVRRFTPPATRIANFIAADVARPVTDIVSNLRHGDLAEEAREVLPTLVFRETQVQLGDGSWFLMRIHPNRTVENVIDGVVVTFSEITALKSLEETLRIDGSEGFFRMAFDPWPGCVYVYDLASRRFAYVNRTALPLLGVSRESLAVADEAFWTRLLHPDDALAMGSWDGAFADIRPGLPLRREYRLRDERRLAEAHAAQRAGVPPRRPVPELELRLAHAEAERLRARWEELFSFAPFGYVILDSGALIVDANLAAAALLGCDGMALVGRPLSRFVAPGELAAIEGFLSEVRRSAEKRSCGLRLRPEAGAEIEAALDAILLPPEVEPGGLVQIAIQDVTLRNRAEAAGNRLLLELQESMARVKQLSGLLPICASCKRIRDDSGCWQQVEEYVSDHSEAEFTHGLCPECLQKLYPERGSGRSGQ